MAKAASMTVCSIEEEEEEEDDDDKGVEAEGLDEAEGTNVDVIVAMLFLFVRDGMCWWNVNKKAIQNANPTVLRWNGTNGRTSLTDSRGTLLSQQQQQQTAAAKRSRVSRTFLLKKSINQSCVVA